MPDGERARVSETPDADPREGGGAERVTVRAPSDSILGRRIGGAANPAELFKALRDAGHDYSMGEWSVLVSGGDAGSQAVTLKRRRPEAAHEKVSLEVPRWVAEASADALRLAARDHYTGGDARDAMAAAANVEGALERAGEGGDG